MVWERDFLDLGSRGSTCVADCETNGVLLEQDPNDGTAILQSPHSYLTPVSNINHTHREMLLQ